MDTYYIRCFLGFCVGLKDLALHARDDLRVPKDLSFLPWLAATPLPQSTTGPAAGSVAAETSQQLPEPALVGAPPPVALAHLERLVLANILTTPTTMTRLFEKVGPKLKRLSLSNVAFIQSIDEAIKYMPNGMRENRWLPCLLRLCDCAPELLDFQAERLCNLHPGQPLETMMFPPEDGGPMAFTVRYSGHRMKLLLETIGRRVIEQRPEA